MTSGRPCPQPAPRPGGRGGERLTAGVLAVALGLMLWACEAKREIAIPEADLESVKHFKKLVDVTSVHNRLLVYSFGSPPLVIGQDRIQGDGLHLLVVNRGAQEASFGRAWSEASNGAVIDYSEFDTGVLRLTSLTIDRRAKWDELVPFILTTVMFDRDGLRREEGKILIQPESGGPERIRRLTEQALAALEEGELEEAYCRPLEHLRNIAVADPAPVLEAYKRLAGKVDGAYAEILRDRVDEVEWMKAIRGED